MNKHLEVRKTNTSIAVIILNWRNINATVESVKSVAASQKIIPEVFLLDNGTEEIAFQKLKKQLEEVKINIHFFASYQNLGFAGGVNYVVNQINLENYAAIFLLNNDARVTRSTLYTLSKESKNNDAPILGPKNKTTGTQSSRRWPWWLFGLQFPQKYNNQNIKPASYIDGSGLFISSSLVQKIKIQRGSLLKNSYFLYGEDTELGLYAKKMDIQPYVTSKATYIHQTGSYETERRRMLTYYYITRNRLYLCEEYLNMFLKPLFHLYYSLSRLSIISYRLIKGERKLATAIIEGLKDGYTGKFGKWKKHPQ